MRVGRVVGCALAAVVVSLSSTATASAQSRDAVSRCQATAVQYGGGADVPESHRFEYFGSVPADDGSAEELLCGDGLRWGAVHIEVKHRVVSGSNGMITSYPWDGGSEGSWAECAQQ